MRDVLLDMPGREESNGDTISVKHPLSFAQNLSFFLHRKINRLNLPFSLLCRQRQRSRYSTQFHAANSHRQDELGFDGEVGTVIRYFQQTNLGRLAFNDQFIQSILVFCWKVDAYGV